MECYILFLENIGKMVLCQITILILIRTCTANLIKNGDFEAYSNLTFKPYYDLKYASIPLNPSIWYSPNSNRIDIEYSISIVTTIGADMSGSAPLNLCQDVNISVGSKYSLFFSLYSFRFNTMTGKAWINQILVSKVFIPLNYSFGNSTHIFYASQQFNTFCFNETHAGVPGGVGGMIDNITLLLEKQYILFNYYADELTRLLKFSGNMTYDQHFAIHFKNRVKLFIEGKLVEYVINNLTDGNITLEVQISFNFNLNSVVFEINTQKNETEIQISLAFNRSDLTYYFLQENQVNFLTKSRDFLIMLNDLLVKASNSCRVYFVSYFIFSIIDIEYLSLFYIFTQVKTIPKFVKKIYHQLLTVIFLNQNFLHYVENLFRMSFGEIIIPIQNEFTEKIQNQRNSEPWLGTYDLSSKVITNNLDSIVALSFLLVKLVVLKIIFAILIKVAPSFSQTMKIRKFSVLKMLIFEFCFMAPTFVVSMEPNILSSFVNLQQKSYKIFCLISLKVCILCLVYFMYCKSTKKKNYNNKLNNEKLLQKNPLYSIIMKSKNYSFSSEIFVIPALFFIPFIVSTGNAPLFLILNTFVVLLRAAAMKAIWSKRYILLQKIIHLISIIAWVVHHSVFSIAFVASDSLTQNSFIMIGITSILTVLIIVLMQILKLIIQILIRIYKILKLTVKMGQFWKNNQIQPQQKQNSQKKQRTSERKNIDEQMREKKKSSQINMSKINPYTMKKINSRYRKQKNVDFDQNNLVVIHTVQKMK